MAMRSDFGKRLLDSRRHAGLTQVQLAKAAGMSHGNYAELEKVGVGSSFTPQIAEACGVSAHWLATGDGQMLSKQYEPATEPGRIETKPQAGVSPAALELAVLFDLIPAQDKIRRARAYNAASSAILDILQEPPSNVDATSDQQKQSA